MFVLPHADALGWRYDDYVARESFGRVAKSLLPLSLWD